LQLQVRYAIAKISKVCVHSLHRLQIRSRLLKLTQNVAIAAIAAGKPIPIPQPRAILSLALYLLPATPVTGLEEEVVGADITTTGELLCVLIATAVPFAMIAIGVGIEAMVKTFDAVRQQE
jgi:hypothetical protein